LSSWIKYFLLIAFIVGVLVFTIIFGLRHQANVTSTQEMDVGMVTANVGKIREDLTSSMIREEAIAEMLTEVATTQKNHDGETLVEYVFLDEDDKPTSDESKIKSIQFVVKLLGKNDKVLSTSTERIEIHEMKGVN